MLRPRLLIAAFFAAASCVPSSAEVTPGEILMAEMNCIACHQAAPEITRRLAPRTSPVLGDLRLTPAWLQDFLADPQKAKPGTLMPDMLHRVPPEQKAKVIEELTHFLVKSQRGLPFADIGASPAKIETGKMLYHSVGCVQCHAPFEPPKGARLDDAAKAELIRLQEQSVPLAGPKIAQKYTVGELAAFLRDPLKVRLAGRMPSLKLDTAEAEAIAMYLLRDQVPAGKPMTLAGLQYEYYEQDLPELPEFDRLTPTTTGIADVPSLKQAKRKGAFALRWKGNLLAPQDGRYKFYLSTDDGSRLYLGGKLILDNGGIHPAQERVAELDLKAGAQSFVLTYFDGGGQTAFDLKWRGPGIEKGQIDARYFSHDGQPLVPVAYDASFKVDDVKSENGALHFSTYQCAKCHAGPTPSSVAIPTLVKTFDRLRPRQPIGCLSPAPPERAAKFDLTDRQRTVIVSGLQSQAVLSEPLTPDQQIKRTMTTLNCYACHQRDKRGGVEGLRRDYLSSVGEADLGDEGRIPPHLHHVGAKLQPTWIRSVLSEGAAVRPYMATRMPQFGKANVDHLVEAFEQADALPDARAQLNNYTDGAGTLANKYGRKLVGTNGGLSCIACHDFAGNKSLGVPAIDLATSGQRLKWDWFRRYLLDPQSLRPGTRMPAFWPGGVATNKDVLGGDSEQQIASIWLYLARKNFTDLPDGLVQGKMEIVPGQEAVIYRNFIEGGGPRAIGVGYPEKANLCFDANELRISMIWQGPFIDASRHQTGRGAGFERPLGTNVYKLPKAPSFAILASETTTWPSEKPLAAGAPFRGYRLDEKQRPTFRYEVAGFEIEDYPIAVPGEVDASFHRTLSVKGPAPASGKLYFRAATGKITKEKDAYLIDDKLRLKFPGAHAIIRGEGTKAELLVPVELSGGKATIVEELTW